MIRRTVGPAGSGSASSTAALPQAMVDATRPLSRAGRTWTADQAWVVRWHELPVRFVPCVLLSKRPWHDRDVPTSARG